MSAGRISVSGVFGEDCGRSTLRMSARVCLSPLGSKREYWGTGELGEPGEPGELGRRGSGGGVAEGERLIFRFLGAL